MNTTAIQYTCEATQDMSEMNGISLYDVPKDGEREREPYRVRKKIQMLKVKM